MPLGIACVFRLEVIGLVLSCVEGCVSWRWAGGSLSGRAACALIAGVGAVLSAILGRLMQKDGKRLGVMTVICAFNTVCGGASAFDRGARCFAAGLKRLVSDWFKLSGCDWIKAAEVAGGGWRNSGVWLCGLGILQNYFEIFGIFARFLSARCYGRAVSQA